MSIDANDPRITRYVFDELEGDAKQGFENELAASAELRQLVEETRQTVAALEADFRAEVGGGLTPEQRAEIVRAAEGAESRPESVTARRTNVWPRVFTAASVMLVVSVLSYGLGRSVRTSVEESVLQAMNAESTDEASVSRVDAATVDKMVAAIAKRIEPDSTEEVTVRWDENGAITVVDGKGKYDRSVALNPVLTQPANSSNPRAIKREESRLSGIGVVESQPTSGARGPATGDDLSGYKARTLAGETNGRPAEQAQQNASGTTSPGPGGWPSGSTRMGRVGGTPIQPSAPGSPQSVTINSPPSVTP